MKWLRKLIGTEDIYNQINDLNRYITGLRGEIGRLNEDITVPLANLTAIMCDEHSDVRRAASDRLATQTLDQMRGDALARAHTEGKF